MSTSWHTQYSESVNFILSIASAGLNNAPCIKKSTYNRVDSVIGWGKMSVPTSNGPSIVKDVLMLKRSTNAIDSFFVAGNPAPTQLLSAFGLSQGMQTNTNRYMFWQKNSVYPMMMINFGSNNFLTPQNIYIDGDINSVDIDNYENKNISIYPNPANEYLNVNGLNNAKIILIDMNGKIVYENYVNDNHCSISLLNYKNGVYLLKIIENSKTNIKQIIINH